MNNGNNIKPLKNTNNEIVIDMDTNEFVKTYLESKNIQDNRKTNMIEQVLVDFARNYKLVVNNKTTYDRNNLGELENYLKTQDLNLITCLQQGLLSVITNKDHKYFLEKKYISITFKSLKISNYNLNDNILTLEYKVLYYTPDKSKILLIKKIDHKIDFKKNGKAVVTQSFRILDPDLINNNNNKINNIVNFWKNEKNISELFFIENINDVQQLNIGLNEIFKQIYEREKNNKIINLVKNQTNKNINLNLNFNDNIYIFINLLLYYFNLLNNNEIQYNIEKLNNNIYLIKTNIGLFNIAITNKDNKLIIEKSRLKSRLKSILPLQKNNNINLIKSNNILIISFNEANKRYNNEDINIILDKIIKEQPLFVVVNTQESLIRQVTGRVDFHNYLSKALSNKKYSELDRQDARVLIATIGLSKNKNVRTSIYFNQTKVTKNNNNEKIKIISFGHKVSKKSNLGKAIKKTWWKGSICYELIIEANGKTIKFIFVNSHLFFESKSYKGKKNDKNDTGLKKRIHNFESLVKEFKLIEKYEEGYNIFFSGDLNFRLTLLGPNMKSNFKEYLFQMNKLKNKNTIDNYLLDTVKKYLKKLKAMYNEDNNERNAYNTTLYVKNEIKNFLESKKNNDLYKEFNKSIKELGTHLSMKYPESTQDDLINFYTLYIIDSKNIDKLTFNEIEKIFKIYSKEGMFKTNKVPRPPSMPDRILCATHEDDILPLKKKDLKMYLFPDKSDHKMISLDIRLDLEKSNLNNLKPVVKNFKQKKKKLLTYKLNDINTLDKFKEYLEELNKEAPLQKMSIQLINKIESLFTNDEKEYLSKLQFNKQYHYFIQKYDKTYHFNELLFTKIMNGTLNTSGNSQKLHQFYFCDSSS